MYIKLQKLLVEELSKAAKDYKKLVRATQKKGIEQGTDAFDMEHMRVLKGQMKVPRSKKRDRSRTNSNEYALAFLGRLIRKKKA